jgi:hypothetical protein
MVTTFLKLPVIGACIGMRMSAEQKIRDTYHEHPKAVRRGLWALGAAALLSYFSYYGYLKVSGQDPASQAPAATTGVPSGACHGEGTRQVPLEVGGTTSVSILTLAQQASDALGSVSYNSNCSLPAFVGLIEQDNPGIQPDPANPDEIDVSRLHDRGSAVIFNLPRAINPS